MQLGDRIKNLRVSAGLTQAQLADKIGVHGQSVSKWERDLVLPDLAIFDILCKEFGVSLEALVGFDAQGVVHKEAFNAEKISQAIIEIRKKSGLNQADFAAKISESSDSVSKWERGIIYPDIEKIIKIANAFSLLPSDIYYGTIGNAVAARDTKRKRTNKLTLILIISLLALAITALILTPILYNYFNDAPPSQNINDGTTQTPGDNEGNEDEDESTGDNEGNEDEDESTGDNEGGEDEDESTGDNEGSEDEEENTGDEIVASQGLTFTLNGDGQSYAVTGKGACSDLDIIIPAMHEGLPVTVIGEMAFFNAYITSITIPDSVTSIEIAAFSNCLSLERVTLGSGINSIGFLAFADCAFLTDISYVGTVEQWNAVLKDESWTKNVLATIVKCSDGNSEL